MTFTAPLACNNDVQLIRHTRPLRVLIAFKRHEVTKLQMQLCDLLEVHADSSAFVRKTESKIADLEKELASAERDVKGKTVAISTLEQQVSDLQAEKVRGKVLWLAGCE